MPGDRDMRSHTEGLKVKKIKMNMVLRYWADRWRLDSFLNTILTLSQNCAAISSSCRENCCIFIFRSPKQCRWWICCCSAKHRQGHLSCQLVGLVADPHPLGRFLLQVNRRNSRGFTALHAAAENGHVSVMCRGFDVSEARTAGCCEDLKFEQSNHHDCLLACVV